MLRGGDTLSNFYNFYELAVPVFFQLLTFFVSIHTFLLLGGVKDHYFLPSPPLKTEFKISLLGIGDEILNV